MRLLCVTLLIAGLALLGPTGIARADRSFAPRYATNQFGDIATIGNTLMTCPDAEADCAAARAGTATGTANDDNAHAMTYVDVDGDATTFDSSRATLSLPAGAGVLWAGLYWGGDLSGTGASAPPNAAFNGAVRLTAPGGGAAASVTAAQIDTSATQTNRYHAFAEVTDIVRAAGNGDYTVANVQSGQGADHYAGWTLVVAYTSGTQERNLRIYDGFKPVNSGAVDIGIGGLLTPATGTVAFRMGLVSYEGDRGLTGDTAALDSTTLTNGLNPSNNVFNSTVAAADGTRFSAKTPDYVNQLGYDSDVFSLDGVLGNNATSATLHLTTSGDVYLPGVITTAIDRANTPPSSDSAPGFSTGTPRDGDPITATPGSWSGTPTITYGYQWQRCDGSGAACGDIDDADQATYTPDSPDVGHALRVVVTAHNPIGDQTVTSAPTAAVAPAPPVNTVVPAISGTTRDGSTLTATDGTWSGSTPMTLTRQWRRCAADGTGCVDITDATGATYDLVAADVGKTVRVAVRAANDAGNATATSLATAVVDPVAASAQAAPAISGTARDGSTLTGDRGTWTGTPDIVFAYRWQRCDELGDHCADIGGAQAATYALTPDDVGHTLRFVVRATNGAGTVEAASAPSDVVEPLAPAVTTPPTISGLARDGSTLSATAGTWTGTPDIAYAFQWRRCDADGNGCSDIDDATGATRDVTPDDAGHVLRVAVIATNAAGSVTEVSAPTGRVGARGPRTVAAPSITGTERDGSPLTAHAGAWSGTPEISFAYRWRRCWPDGGWCVDVDGATAETYDLTPADVGHVMQVVVTAANAGGADVAQSAPTGRIGARPPANMERPDVAGTARDGETLHAGTGRWTGTPEISFSYQWRRCDDDGCVDVDGATNADYELTAADVGRALRVAVTASNAGGSAEAASDDSDVVAAAAPESTSLAAISGLARDGETLTADPGTWSGTPELAFAYQWLRCDAGAGACAEVDGARERTYVLTPADVGHVLRVAVTATNAAGAPAAQSAPSDIVAARPPVNTTPPPSPSEQAPAPAPAKPAEPAAPAAPADPEPTADVAGAVAPPRLISAPVVTGIRRPGEVLVASTGEWASDEPLVFDFQWRLCDADGTNCVDIPGATGRTYTMASGDAGRRVAVVVTARLTSGAAEASAETDDIDLSDLPGSLVAPAACARLESAVAARALRAGRLGTFRLRVGAPHSRSASWAPAVARVTGPVARLRRVRLALDGHALGARGALAPGLLARGDTHRVRATLVPRHGRARRIEVVLRSARCSAVFTAGRRPGRATRTLFLRMDSRSALRSVSFVVPEATARNILRTSRTGLLGYLRVMRAGAKRSAWRLRGPVDGRLLRRPGTPGVELSGTTLRVTGLPQQTGIATLSLIRPLVRGAQTPALRLAGGVATKTGWTDLTFSLLAGRGA